MKKIFHLTLLLLLAVTIQAQDAVFLNSQQFLVYQNPSFAGSNGGFRFQSVYRNQANSSANYVVYYNSADLYLKKINAGMAVTYVNEDWKRGMLRDQTISYSYAQYFSLADNKLKIIPSLQFEVIKKQLDPSKMSFSDYYTTSLTQQWSMPEYAGVQKKYNYNLSSGLLINYNRFYFGASLFHINQPNVGVVGDAKLPSRLSMYTSANLTLTKWTKANLSVRYEWQTWYKCAYFNWNTITANHILFNLGVNTKGLANAGLGYRADFFSISASYGAFADAINLSLNDIFEVHLSVNVRNKEQRKSFPTTFEAQ